jgi:hypothetical protein
MTNYLHLSSIILQPGGGLFQHRLIEGVVAVRAAIGEMEKR